MISNQLPSTDRRALPVSWGWIVAAGVLMIMLGIVALGSLAGSTRATTFLVGAALLVAAVAQIFGALSAETRGRTALQVLVGLLYLVAGWQLVTEPFFAAVAVTLVIGVILVAAGIARIVTALVARPAHWGWVALGGAVTTLIGALLWAGWPATGAVAIGLFLGIELIISGLGWVVVGLVARRAPVAAGAPPA